MSLSVDNGTTVDVDTLTADKASVLAGEEDVGGTKLGWLSNSTNRSWASVTSRIAVTKDLTYQGCCAKSSSSPCPWRQVAKESIRVQGRRR